MTKKTISTFIFLIFFGIFVFAGKGGYIIKFRIHGLKDTICLVANYYGNGTYIIDTLAIDGNGRCTFKAPADQPRGVYILVISDKNYFDFIVNNDKKFSMVTDKRDPVSQMKITGSPDNEEFYEYMRYNQVKFKEIQELQAWLKVYQSNADSVEVITERSRAINDEIIAYKLKIVEDRPFSFLAMLINAMKEPIIKEIPGLPDGQKDSHIAYRFFKTHFWDDMDLADSRLIRTPVFHKKLKKYFDKVVVQHPDSIFKEAIILIEQARPDPEMFKYIVWFIY